MFLGLRERLLHEVLPFIAASETSNEYQCKEIKFSNMPEYFTVYKDALAFNESAFLGGAIVSKVYFYLFLYSCNLTLRLFRLFSLTLKVILRREIIMRWDLLRVI